MSRCVILRRVAETDNFPSLFTAHSTTVITLPKPTIIINVFVIILLNLLLSASLVGAAAGEGVAVFTKLVVELLAPDTASVGAAPLGTGVTGVVVSDSTAGVANAVPGVNTKLPNTVVALMLLVCSVLGDVVTLLIPYPKATVTAPILFPFLQSSKSP